MATAAQIKAQKILQTVAAVIDDSTPDTPRQAILNEASKIVHNDRNKSYGDPEDNFRNIAAVWNAYLAAKHTELRSYVNSADVPIMMILMKTARLATNQNHHDSTVDIAGYAACLGDIQDAAKMHEDTTAGWEMHSKQDTEQPTNSMYGKVSPTVKQTNSTNFLKQSP